MQPHPGRVSDENGYWGRADIILHTENRARMASEIFDDKTEHCLPFLLERLEVHKSRHTDNPNPPPFFVGLNGIQGAGKTVLVSEHDIKHKKATNTRVLYLSRASPDYTELQWLYKTQFSPFGAAMIPSLPRDIYRLRVCAPPYPPHHITSKQ